MQRNGVKQRSGVSTVVEASPLLTMAGDWRRLLCSAVGDEEWKRLRQRERTGRPLGDDEFLVRLEQRLGRFLRRQKPGRKDKQAGQTIRN
jgi:putative transposase